jgi:flavin-binding protein dodecin
VVQHISSVARWTSVSTGTAASPRDYEKRPGGVGTPLPPSRTGGGRTKVTTGSNLLLHTFQPDGGFTVADHTYAINEIVGTSPEGVKQAIDNGIARASQTLRNLDWFELVSVRGSISDGAVSHYQVTMKVGMRLDDPS